MSLSLYSTALVWHSQRGGVAKLHGRQVVLTEAPPILRLRLVMVEYLPEIGQRELQEATGPRRYMTGDEVAAADVFLRALPDASPSRQIDAGGAIGWVVGPGWRRGVCAALRGSSLTQSRGHRIQQRGSLLGQPQQIDVQPGRRVGRAGDPAAHGAAGDAQIAGQGGLPLWPVQGLAALD